MIIQAPLVSTGKILQFTASTTEYSTAEFKPPNAISNYASLVSCKFNIGRCSHMHNQRHWFCVVLIYQPSSFAENERPPSSNILLLFRKDLLERAVR